MSLLAIIPARGGSKGIPRKNIKNFCGKPLIAWTIEVAQQAPKIDHIFVSTDDEEIAQVAKVYGVDVPFLRPPELAADSTPAISTALHVLEAFNDFDEVLWLQPTSPLRSLDDVNQLLKLALNQGASSVVSVTPVKANPNWMYRFGEHQLLVKWIDESLVLDRHELPKPTYLMVRFTGPKPTG